MATPRDVHTSLSSSNSTTACGGKEKIKRAHDEGATTFDQLLSRAYDDAPEQALPWARHSLDAHLAKLGIEMQAAL